MFIIDHYLKDKHFLNQQIFEKILRSTACFIDDLCLESLWNLCQPMNGRISKKIFLQHFAPLKSIDSSNQCQIFNYITRISSGVKQSWEHLKNEFFSLDRYGRLFITIDQAINLMRNYCLPLNENQQCELALLFSPKKNGQFYYFDFMKYFTNQSALNNIDRSSFSRFTYQIQSKQSWTCSLVTIDCLFNRIRSECIKKYESIYRMFKTIDKDQQGYLNKIQLNQLLKQFDIQLNEDELYHIVSEIDKNQDGIISYNELYYSLVSDALQI